ncbi:asparagine synthase (glutamine-hydrolysing) [Chitinophaga sp. YR573]|uniref:asparagine synthase-related protein n=1 Tax=Chitinophaga sp. YR573 TaxID=1881040 RepID=UPI0008B961FF|nr:asparagine synthase-related protein [Chitinophaga sp. YR573]SEW43004.1 asparagine synthase (glutamine-hydrolysing) [Chitinophaga sp. YR573]
MSAIFGIIHKNKKPVDQGTIHRMKVSLAHRAIDGMEIWQDEHVMIGHCKLLMVAIEQQQKMPFVTQDLIISADIRIDNRAYIIQQTGAQNALTDIVLLHHAYLKWGEQCVQHLEGEYAFCIWNRITQQCFIATDHIGFRSLYYYDSPDTFIFCSEQKGIAAVKPGPYQFNEISLMEYYFRQSDPSGTYDADISALCGGNMLILKDNNICIKKYWVPEGGKYSFKRDEEWTGCLKELLFEAVKNRMITDKPIGITLSGGLDSSALTCILSDLLARVNKPLYAFSSVLPDAHTEDEQDEKKYIDIIGKHCPNLVQTYVTAEEYGPFDNIVAAFENDETFPNVFYYMDYAILNAARDKHIGMLYTGYGGDHWVSWKGNPVIRNMINKGRVTDAWKLIKGFSKTEGKGLMEIIKREYLSHTRWRKKKSDEVTAAWLQNGFFNKYKQDLNFDAVKDITSFMCNKIRNGRTGIFPAMLAKRNERFGMQSAVPLFDKHVLEFMIDVPQQLFVRGGYKRSLLRHAMAGIMPPEVLWRHDKGMYSPDYVSRTMKHAGFIQEVITSEKYAIGFKHYLSREGYTGSNDVQDIICTTQGVIASTILSDLHAKGYSFSTIS